MFGFLPKSTSRQRAGTVSELSRVQHSS